MAMIQPVQPGSASDQQKKLLEGLKARMGKVPNIYGTIAHSPSTLEAMMAYSAGLKKGFLTPQEIETIALAVAEKNRCDYCLAAHTVMGKMAGLTPGQMIEARQGKAADPKMDALIRLAVEVTGTQGYPSTATVEAVRKAGYSDGAVIEIVAWVAFNIFTNYINHVAGTELDFPAAPRMS